MENIIYINPIIRLLRGGGIKNFNIFCIYYLSNFEETQLLVQNYKNIVNLFYFRTLPFLKERKIFC